MNRYGTLIFFCGKMGSGKSRKAIEMAREIGAILLSEDDWLSKIYPEEINSFNNYLKYSSRLKPLIKTHVQNILKSGVSVILDFPGNTRTQREWFKEIFSEFNLPHRLIYLEADDQLCLTRIAYRRESNPERAKFDTEEVFRHVTSYFQPPCTTEGFNIEVVKCTNE
jgi:predicted kinase